MNITSVKYNPVSINKFRHKSANNQSVNFKRDNSNDILNIWGTKSLSQRAQVSFCNFISEKKWEDNLIDIINNTPDDQINNPVYFFDGHFQSRSYILLADAAKIGSLKAIGLLLQRGANPNVIDSEDNTALMNAAQFGQSKAINTLHKFKNINVNQANRYGETALMRAIEYGQLEAVKALLEFENIDIKQTDNMGETALSMAKSYKQPKIVEMLESVM